MGLYKKFLQEAEEQSDRATHAEKLFIELKGIIEAYETPFAMNKTIMTLKEGLLSITTKDSYMSSRERLSVQILVRDLMAEHDAYRKTNPAGSTKRYEAARALQSIALEAETYGLFTPPHESISRGLKNKNGWHKFIDGSINIMAGAKHYHDNILFENLGIAGFENTLKKLKLGKGMPNRNDIEGLKIAIEELKEYNDIYMKGQGSNRAPEDDFASMSEMHDKIAKDKKKMFLKPMSEEIISLEPPKNLAAQLELVLSLCEKANVLQNLSNSHDGYGRG